MAKPSGATLVIGAVRPNDDTLLIATALQNEIKGGHHSYDTISKRDSIIQARREWGMLCTIYDDPTPSLNKTYKLVFNHVDTDIMNNNNWVDLKDTLNIGEIVNTPVSYDGLTGSSTITSTTFSIALPNIITASQVGGINSIPIFSIDKKGRVIATSSYTLPTNYETISYSGISTLITNKQLVPNKLYEIIDIDPTLYGGTSVYLTAISNESLDDYGIGKFYNPKYDTYPIFQTSGTYNIGSTVTWGGKIWVNISGSIGSIISSFALSADWTAINYNTSFYNITYDKIKVLISDNIITYREDKYNNVVSCSRNYRLHLSDNSKPSPILYFQWGNDSSLSSPISGIVNNKVIDSYFNIINFTGGRIYNNTLTNRSYIDLFTFKSNSYIDGLILDNSYMSSFTLNEYSYLKNIIMFNSSQYDITLNSFAYQLGLYFKNSSQYNLVINTTKSQTNLNFNNYSFNRFNINLNVNEINVTVDNNTYYRKLTGIEYIEPTINSDYVQKEYVDNLIGSVTASITNINYDGLTGSSNFILGNTISISLPNIVTASTIGSSSSIPIITYDSKGRIINVDTSTINIPTNVVNLDGNSIGSTISIGSNDDNDFIVKTNNINRLLINNTGSVFLTSNHIVSSSYSVATKEYVDGVVSNGLNIILNTQTHINYDGLTGSSSFNIGSSFSVNLPNIISASTIGSSNQIPIITYDNKGRIISTTTSNITLNSNIIYDGLTGDSTLNIGETFSISLPNIITASTIGTSVSIPIITYDNKGRITNTENVDIHFNSKRFTSREDLPEVNTNSEKLIDFLDNYFYPDRSPEISLIYDNSAVNREYGDASLITVTYTVTKKTYGIFNIKIGENDITPDTSISSNGATYNTTYTDMVDINAATAGTYTNFVIDNNSNQIFNNIDVTYNKAIYSGIISSTSSIDENIIITTYIDYKITSDLSYEITNLLPYSDISGTYFYVAIPSELTLTTNPKFIVNGFYDNDWSVIKINNTLNRFGFDVGDYDVWYSNNIVYSNYFYFKVE